MSDVTRFRLLHVTSALANKTKTKSGAGANDATFTAVAANASNHSMLFFQSSAVTGGADVTATAQRLMLWIDTGTNFAIVPNGGDATIAWDSRSNHIFKL